MEPLHDSNKAGARSNPIKTTASTAAAVDSRQGAEPPRAGGQEIPRGQDIPPRYKDSDSATDARGKPKGVFCEYCDLPGVDNSKGRNIVVCLDGTANQYGEFNTNVVELFSRVIQDDRQVTYYSSGIGTYARPTWRSFSYYKQVLGHLVDLAIAWKFERVILEVYEWLCTEYRPGDRIYFFGFSRGAYQVRTLAAMIAQIGLLRPGHKAQIPFAFELYAGLKSGPDRTKTQNMVKKFKKTFSREDVPVHFVGTWDAVSSVGLARDKNMPGTDEFNAHVCYFRHALALDERRVKFLPEYICSGESDTTPRTAKSGVPRVKEVWFAGCHSDIGGGNVSNTELNNAAIPVLWMANEARFAGLRLQRSEVEWQWDKLRETKPTESLSWFWKLLEILPITRLSYTGPEKTCTTRTPHFARGRVVKPGQKIHASVTFIQGYTPRATLAHADTEFTWEDIIGSGTLEHRDWIKDILELDLFDLENVSQIVDSINDNLDYTDFIGRLKFLALTREGAESIVALESALMLLNTLLKKKDRVDTAISLLQMLVPHDAYHHTIMRIDLIRTLQELSESGSTSGRRGAIVVLRLMAEKCGVFPLPSEKPNGVATDTVASDQDDSSRHLVLLYLASINLTRYKRSETRADLAAAERGLQDALAMLRRSNPHRPFVQNGLATVAEARATISDIESSIAIRRQVVENTSEPSVFWQGLAKSLINFATLLSAEAVRPEDVYRATEEAVGLYRKLSESDHATFDQDLAMSLNNLCNRHAELGDREKALEAVDEAVVLYRRLAEPTHSQFKLYLATSLTNQAGRLAALGSPEQALSAAEEAVRLHREVAVAGLPLSIDSSELAAALISLSYCLRDLDRREEALEAIEESRKIYLRLSQEAPAAFNANLADTLHGLASRLSDLGRCEEALAANEQAVALRRALAAEGPATFNPALASSLNSLSLLLSDLGRHEEALAAIEEAVWLYRALAADRPAASNPDLAMSLHSLSLRLSDLGRRNEALSAIEEAARLYRALAADRPAVFSPDLANSLNDLSVDLSSLGRREEALQAIEEAAGLRRALASDRPAVFNRDLARSLNNLSFRLSDLGRREEALAVIKESVGLRRALAADRPIIFNPHLARSLNKFSLRLSDVGRREEALQAVEESAEIYRALAVDRRATFSPAKANFLDSLSTCLSKVGRAEDALEAIQESVRLYRGLAADRPSAFNLYLAMSLNTLSVCLSNLGHTQDALETIKEAVKLRRGFAAEDPSAFNPVLAESLNHLSTCLSDVGHREDALRAIEEAVVLRRSLAADRPAAFNWELAESLYNFSLRLSDLDRRKDALETVEESVVFYRPLAEQYPVVFTDKLKQSLVQLSRCLSDLGRAADAIEIDAVREKLN